MCSPPGWPVLKITRRPRGAIRRFYSIWRDRLERKDAQLLRGITVRGSRVRQATAMCPVTFLDRREEALYGISKKATMIRAFPLCLSTLTTS
ncbi:hypothetical protein CSUI_001268, partial [Cystoisospora suis]